MGKKYGRIIIIFITVAVFFSLAGCDSGKYKKAKRLLEEGDSINARVIFSELEDYEDSPEYVKRIDYDTAVGLYSSGDKTAALDIFKKIEAFEDSREYIKKINYSTALEFIENGEMQSALTLMLGLEGYEESKEYADKLEKYIAAEAIIGRITGTVSAEKYKESSEAFAALGNFSDSAAKSQENLYQYASALHGESTSSDIIEKGTIAAETFESLGSYKDSASIAVQIREEIHETEYQNLVSDFENQMKSLRVGQAKSFFAKNLNSFESYTGYKDAADYAAACAEQLTFFEGRALLLAGSYSEALEKLETVDMYDCDILRDYLYAMIKYEEDDKPVSVEHAVQCILKSLEAGSSRTGYNSTDDINNLTIESYSSDADILALIKEVSILNNLIYDYWNTQADAGLNPENLETLPASQENRNLFGFSIRSDRKSSLSATLNTQKLQDYYASSGTGKSPVEVTGDGIYVNCLRNSKSGYGYDIGIDDVIPLFANADKPENIRYLLLTTVSHSYHADWEYVSNGKYAGTTYHTTVTVVLKDCVTGKILYKKSQKTQVPDNFRMSGTAYYAPTNFDTADVKAMIKELYENW